MRLFKSRGSAAAGSSQSAAPQYAQNAPARSGVPRAESVASGSVGAPERVHVRIPPGARPGTTLQFPNSRGQQFRAQVPPGVPPGGVIIVEIPAVRGPNLPTPVAQAVGPRAVASAVPAASGGLYPSLQAQGGFAPPPPPPPWTPTNPPPPPPWPPGMSGMASAHDDDDDQLAAAIAASLSTLQEEQQDQELLASALEESSRSARSSRSRSRGVVSASDGVTIVADDPGESAAPTAHANEGADAAPILGTPVEQMPSLLRSLAEGQKLAECPICFEDLCAQPCAVFKRGGHRVCSHFLHEACALSLPSRDCPLCRAAFCEVVRVPSLSSDPGGWFECVDVEGDGRLSKAQVLEVLTTQFPLDMDKAEGAIDELWPRWDLDGSGYVTRAEFSTPQTGLLAYARAHLLKTPEAAAPVPDISSDRLRWFEYFDEEGRQSLSREAVVRGLIKTYGLGSDLSQVTQMRALVEATWPIFDTANTGFVSREEFLKPGDGLADAIIAARATLR